MELNKVLIIGNLTRDPETRQAGEVPVARMGLASNRRYGGKEEVVFVDVEAWGKTGELCAQYLRKGSQALVEGRLKLDTWEKDGKRNSRIYIVADRVQFGAKAKDEDGAPAARTAPSPQAAAIAAHDGPSDDDDLPF